MKQATKREQMLKTQEVRRVSLTKRHSHKGHNLHKGKAEYEEWSQTTDACVERARKEAQNKESVYTGTAVSCLI